MKARIEALVAALRREEIAVSIAEAMDAARAAALVGVERFALRDALAATLVKDERDRAAFVAAFDAVFPARPGDVPSGRGNRRRRGGAEGGEGGDGGDGGAGAPRAGRRDADEREVRGHGAGARAVDEAAREERARAATGPAAASEEIAERAARRADADAGTGEADDPADAARDAALTEEADAAAGRSSTEPSTSEDATHAAATLARLAGERALMRMPFRAMTPVEVEACAALARAIAARFTARVRRRLRARPTGRLDFRRTIRAAVPRGGVPFERRWRGRRPGAPDLVALCDLSASTAIATDFFLAVLAPASTYFRRVRLYGYVDRLVEIEFEDAQVRPSAPIDLMARSDFGRVLRDLVEREADVLGADTVLLVLGDARNNRRPPRADLLAAARVRVRRVLWLNPDPRERWGTGDSVIAAYARHTDAVIGCATLADLDLALKAVATL